MNGLACDLRDDDAVASHRIASHRIASHRIASHGVAWLAVVGDIKVGRDATVIVWDGRSTYESQADVLTARSSRQGLTKGFKERPLSFCGAWVKFFVVSGK